jgi:hypothetical protein
MSCMSFITHTQRFMDGRHGERGCYRYGCRVILLVYLHALGHSVSPWPFENDTTLVGEQTGKLLQIMDRELWLFGNADGHSYQGRIERRLRLEGHHAASNRPVR